MHRDWRSEGRKCSDALKLRVLWSSRDPHQHEMLRSYDQVLTAIAQTLEEHQAEAEKARI